MAFNDVCDDDSPDDTGNGWDDTAPNAVNDEPDDNGPSDAEIEDMEIERLIEVQE
jgi:hypothetical protein